MEMLGGVFGAAGSIGAAMIGAEAQKYAANTNWAIALMNYYARERERFQARIEASRIEGKQNEGMTDVEGTRTHYVPGKGWVVDETPQNQALRNRERAEKMARLGPDAVMRRQQLQRNEIRQIKEEDRARALFDEMRKRPELTTKGVEDTLYNAATSGINRGFDETAAIGARQALRTQSSAEPMMKEIARARAQELAGAKTQARAQAMQIAPAINDQDQKVRTNLYNLFATRAAAMPDVTFAPSPIDSSPLMAAMKNDKSDLSFKAAQMEGGRLPFIPPNYGTANAVGAAGASLQGLFRNMGGPRFSEGYGGNALFEELERRYRGNEGAQF